MLTGQIETGEVRAAAARICCSLCWHSRRNARPLRLAHAPLRARARALHRRSAAQLPGADRVFCRYAYTYGPDWRVVRGVERGASQVAAKGASSDGSLVWNLPLDITFRSTSAHGWPRLALSVYARDWAGRFVVRGYGSVLLPTVPGRHLRAARMFVPLASTLLQALIGWATGSPPEVRRGCGRQLRVRALRHCRGCTDLPTRRAHPPTPLAQFYDASFAAASDGRDVTRVASTGSVSVALHTLSRGMAAHGFSTGGPPDLADVESEGEEALHAKGLGEASWARLPWCEAPANHSRLRSSSSTRSAAWLDGLRRRSGSGRGSSRCCLARAALKLRGGGGGGGGHGRQQRQ